MVLFEGLQKIAGVSFGHRQASIVALARRGMLNEVMLQKVPLSKGIVGPKSGLDWGIQVLAKGRKRVHHLGWVPDELLAQGYGKNVLFGAESKASVFYKGKKAGGLFGVRYGLPKESEFLGGAVAEAATAATPTGPGTFPLGLGLGAAVAGTLLFSFLNKRSESDELAPLSNSLGKAHGGTGFPESGIGPLQRKVLTDFGSGFNPIKAIARKVGMSLDDLIKTKAFQSALRTPMVETTGKYATRTMTAGAGSESVLQRWGEMSLPVTTSAGTKMEKFRFPFIEKKVSLPEKLKLEVAATKGVKETGKDLEAIREALHKQASNPEAIKAARRDLNTFPELYGADVGSGRIFSEAIPGVTFDQYLTEVNRLKPKIGVAAALRQTTDKYKLPYTSLSQIEKDIDIFREKMQVVHKRTGITHGDLSAGNVMLTPYGISAIDWAQPRGLTRRLAKTKADVFEQMTERYSTMSTYFDPELTPKYIQTLRREHPQLMAALEGPVADYHRGLWRKEQGQAISELALQNLKGKAKIMSEAIPAQELKRFDWRLETGIDYLALDELKMTVRELKQTHRFTVPGLANKLEGLSEGGLASEMRITGTDFGSPWQGPIVSAPMAHGMTAPSISPDVAEEGMKASAMMLEGGFMPTSPELKHMAQEMPEAAKAVISQGTPSTYMRNDVPLSSKIKIKGTSNNAGNARNLANIISANIPKSKVNISVRDHRSKLTPQVISDMIEG